MANHKSAAKAYRQSVRKNAVNNKRRSEIKAAVKELRAAVSKNDTKAAKDAFVTAQKKIAKGATNGIIKKNTASRLTSRLNASVKKIAAKKK